MAMDRAAYALGYCLNVCFESEWRRVPSPEDALIHDFNSSQLLWRYAGPARLHCALVHVDKCLKARDNPAPICSLSRRTMPVGIIDSCAPKHEHATRIIKEEMNAYLY